MRSRRDGGSLAGRAGPAAGEPVTGETYWPWRVKRERLAEAREAFERALAHVQDQAALAVQALGQAHGLAQAVDDAQLPQRVARHHHVEAVGAQVDGREHVAVAQRLGGGGDEGGDGQGGAHPQIFASSAACATTPWARWP